MEKESWWSKNLLQVKLVSNNTMENGKKIKCVGQEHIIIVMVQYIKESGRITNNAVQEFINSPMEQYMKDNGWIILCMEQDSLLIIQVANGEDNLEMENFEVNFSMNSSNKKQ